MTTKTQDLKAKLKGIDPDEVKARRAAKRGEYNKATYYAVMVLISHGAIRQRMADMRLKGFIG